MARNRTISCMMPNSVSQIAETKNNPRDNPETRLFRGSCYVANDTMSGNPEAIGGDQSAVRQGLAPTMGP